MKKGDINLLSIGLKNIHAYRVSVASSFLESLSPEGLVKIIKREKVIQDFLNSLIPGKTILVISDINYGTTIWKYYTFVEVENVEERLILVRENSLSYEKKLFHISVYNYGTSLFTLDEYKNFVI